MLKVGMLGAGRIAQVHAQTLIAHPGSVLVAVADPFVENAQKLSEMAGAKVMDSIALIADPDIDAIIVASSTHTHADFIEAGVKAGKAVFCEKPVDLDLARAKTCQEVVKAHNVPVMLGFNRRFDPDFAAMQQAISAGAIGDVALLSVTSYDPAPPPVAYIKVSGGLFRDMMIHDFDIATWMMGGLPETVMAHGANLVDADIGAAGDIDTAVVTLQYASGAMVTIKNSRRAAYGYDQRIEVLGAQGQLQVANVLENRLTHSHAGGVVMAKPEHFFLERYARAYSIEWQAFYEAVTNKTATPTGIDDGVNALAMAEAAAQSFLTKQPISVRSYLS